MPRPYTTRYGSRRVAREWVRWDVRRGDACVARFRGSLGGRRWKTTGEACLAPTRASPEERRIGSGAMSTTAPIAVRHLIGGEWLGEPERERENPARPGEVVARLP